MYNYVNKIKNCTFYIDCAGTYKSNNFLVNWFNSQVIQKSSVKVCILDANPNVDLIKSMLPISMLDINQLYIVNYENKKTRTFQELMFCFDNIEIELSEYENKTPLFKTLHEVLTNIYNSDEIKIMRQKSMLPLTENYKLIENVKNKISNITVPNNSLDIIIDDIESILNWINSNPNNLEYHILCTGSKELITDITNYFDLMKLKNEI